MTILLLTSLLKVSAQRHELKGMLGTDLASIIRNGTTGMIVSHAFDPHWTADGQVYFRLTGGLEKDSELTEHESTFEDSEVDRDVTVPYADLSFCYWTRKAYNGPFISIGCRYERNGIPECMVGAGYSARITDILAFQVSFKTGISSQKSIPEDRITIGLCYLF